MPAADEPCLFGRGSAPGGVVSPGPPVSNRGPSAKRTGGPSTTVSLNSIKVNSASREPVKIIGKKSKSKQGYSRFKLTQTETIGAAEKQYVGGIGVLEAGLRTPRRVPFPRNDSSSPSRKTRGVAVRVPRCSAALGGAPAAHLLALALRLGPGSDWPWSPGPPALCCVSSMYCCTARRTASSTSLLLRLSSSSSSASAAFFLSPTQRHHHNRQGSPSGARLPSTISHRNLGLQLLGRWFHSIHSHKGDCHCTLDQGA